MIPLPTISQYKKLADVPPAELRAILGSLRSLAVQRAIRWHEGWQTSALAGVLLAVRVDRQAAGLRLRLLISPTADALSPADERAVLAALPIDSYIIERLPIRPFAEALSITESYFSRSATKLSAHAA